LKISSEGGYITNVSSVNTQIMDLILKIELD